MINLSDKPEMMTNDSEGKESVSRMGPEHSLDLAPFRLDVPGPTPLLASLGSAQLSLPLSEQTPCILTGKESYDSCRLTLPGCL